MPPDITTGLLLAYHFEAPTAPEDAEYVVDQSGNNRDLRIKTNWRGTGHTGSGLYQDTDIPLDEGIRRSNRGLDVSYRTLMFWAKIGADVAGEYDHAVWMLDGNETCWGIATQEAGGNVWFKVKPTGSPGISFTGIPKQPVGEWHHYAMTYDGNNWRCYLDGVLVYTYAFADTIAGSDGAQHFLLSGTNQQTIDDVRMYDRALSDAEIALAKDTPVSGSAQPQRVLLAEYGFEEGAGTIAGDGSGRGNDAVLYGTEEWAVTGYTGGGYGSNSVPVTSGFDLPYELSPFRFTVMCWYKSVAYPSNESGLFAIGGFDEVFSVLLREAGSFETRFMGSHFDSGGSYRDNAWHHVAATYDGATVTLYIDGAVVGSQVYVTPLNYLYGASWNILFGAMFVGNRDKGIMDDFRLFSYALAPADIVTWMGKPTNLAFTPTRFWRNPNGDWVPLRTTVL